MTKKQYKEYLDSVSRYSTYQEKEACLLSLNPDFNDPIEYAETLGINPKPSNNLEAIAMIFKSREKSVDEFISITLKCEHCDLTTIYGIPIKSLFFNEDEDNCIDESIPVKLYEEPFEIEKEGYNIDDLSIEEFSKLEEKILKNNKLIFSLTTDVTCKKCRLNNKISINYKDIISKFTIKNIYEQYLDITQFTHMNKSDVDKLPPFEREIFINLIQDREDKKEQG